MKKLKAKPVSDPSFQKISLTSQNPVKKHTALMPVPPEISLIAQRLNQELDQTEQEANQVSNLVQTLLSRFPGNAILTQMFALASSTLMFVSNRRQVVRDIINLLEREEVSVSAIQNNGEELSQILGQVVETKIRIIGIKSRLERMQ